MCVWLAEKGKKMSEYTILLEGNSLRFELNSDQHANV